MVRLVIKIQPNLENTRGLTNKTPLSEESNKTKAIYVQMKIKIYELQTFRTRFDYLQKLLVTFYT